MASDIALPQSSVMRVVAPALNNHTVSKDGKAAFQCAAATTIFYLSSLCVLRRRWPQRQL